VVEAHLLHAVRANLACCILEGVGTRAVCHQHDERLPPELSRTRAAEASSMPQRIPRASPALSQGRPQAKGPASRSRPRASRSGTRCASTQAVWAHQMLAWPTKRLVVYANSAALSTAQRCIAAIGVDPCSADRPSASSLGSAAPIR
jgi:hypothetical protein